MALRNTGQSCFVNAATQLIAASTLSLAIQRKDNPSSDEDRFVTLLGDLHEKQHETGIRISVQPTVKTCPAIAADEMTAMWAHVGIPTDKADEPQTVLDKLSDKYTFDGVGGLFRNAHVEFEQCVCLTCNKTLDKKTIEDSFDKSVDTRVLRQATVDGNLTEYLQTFVKCPVDKTHQTKCTLAKGSHSWIVTVWRSQANGAKARGKKVYDNRVTFPYHFPGTNMYLRGFIVYEDGNHYTFCVRHNDGIWWKYNDSTRYPLTPKIALNEQLMNRQYGRQALMFLYDTREADFPPNPLRLR